MTVKNATTFVSTMSITALADAITGGSAYASGPPSVGIYRSAWYLHQFFASFEIDFEVGSRSRVPAVRELLMEINGDASKHEVMRTLFEGAVDPRIYLDVQQQLPEQLSKTVEYLNISLQYDGYELQLHGRLYRLVARSATLSVAAALTERARLLDYSSVSKDFERALNQADADPEDAITAACSTVESVCKCISRRDEGPISEQRRHSGSYARGQKASQAHTRS
jgi:hypothetical protein